MTDAPTALWVAAFASGGLALSLISVRAGLGRLNPVTVYAAVWVSLTALVSSGVMDVAPLTQKTWLILTMASGSFVVGCLGAWSLVGRSAHRRPEPRGERRYDDDRLRRYYRAGMAALTAYVAIQIVQTLPLLQQAGGIGGVLSGEGLAFRRAQNEAAASDAATSFTGGSAALGFLGYVLFIGVITVFWAGYRARRGEWGAALAPLAVLAVYSLFALQRFTFVYGLLLFLASYEYHRHWGRRDARVPVGLLATLGVLALAVVFVPIALRESERGSENATGGPAQYFVSGVAGLNTAVANDSPPPEPSPGYGTWTLYGAASLATRFGLPVQVPDSPVLPFVNVGTGAELPSNVYTYAIYPLYDGGRLALVAFALLLGAISSALHYAVVVRRRLDLLPVACLALVTIGMSFFALSLIRDTRWLFLVAGSLILARAVIRSPAPARTHSATAVPAAG